MQKFFVTDNNSFSQMLVRRGAIFTTENSPEYLQNARESLSDDVKFIMTKELYKTLKHSDDTDVEIILSEGMKFTKEQFISDFPEAIIWVYE